MVDIRYAPPPIDQSYLCRLVLEQYPSHRSRSDLIAVLVSEYVKLWRLVLNYPGRRIVATPCIIAVQKVHRYTDRTSYFIDSMRYFGKFISEGDLAWRGSKDIKGVLETIHAYLDLQGELPPDPWAEMSSIYGMRRSTLKLI